MIYKKFFLQGNCKRKEVLYNQIMKKIVITLSILTLIIITVCLSIFTGTGAKISENGDYRPIPKELSNQYKAEMEQIIDEEYPKIIKKINEDTEYGKNIYQKIMKNGYNVDLAADLGFVYELYLPTEDLDLYAKLVKITQEKYLKIDYDPPGADWVTPFENYLKPYFIDNNVNTKKLQDIFRYEVKQSKLIKHYIDDVQKLVP